MNKRIVFRAFAIWLLAIAQAHAFLREITPGSEPMLGSNEGLLLVSVDTLIPLAYVRLQREGNYFASAKISNLNAGVTAKLFAAPAGKYRWDTVGLSASQYYELSNDVEMKFEIKPGVVNYPGDLLMRLTRGTRSRMRATDRAMQALDWLETTFPTLNSLPFVYVGHYPDAFPDYYRAARATHPQKKLADLSTTENLPKPVTLPVPVDELWKVGRISDVALNPIGDLLAESIYENGEWGIDLIDLQASSATRLINPPFAVDTMKWFGNRTLVTSLGEQHDKNFIAIFQIDDTGPKGRSIRNFNLPFAGQIVGDVANDPSQLLVSSLSPYGQPIVSRIDISSEASVKKAKHDFEARLNKGLSDDFSWYADGSGQIRAALSRVDKQTGLFYGSDGKYQELIRFSGGEDFEFFPYRLSSDGTEIFGFSNSGRNQRDFVAFDPLTRSISKTLFSKPDVDVEGALFNRQGTPIGVTYYEAGHIASNYFDEADRHLNALIDQAFPDRTAIVMARDDAGKRAILGVDGTDFPFAIYALDAEKKRASLLDEYVPALSKRKWAPSIVIHAKGSDGLPIEAYLTLPNAAGKVPLIVLAHGGPIGIRDLRHFDPEVQFLALLGYGVLQVNFRGSEGYGNGYRKAGEGRYGTLIEDDIDSALDAVSSRFPIDASRLCAMGTSYGGYSALMSAIRHPGRFRCVISISGVSDRILSFTASDAAYSADNRKVLEQRIGDPRGNMDGIFRISPIYRIDELKSQVLLVHGTEDERVDYENVRRLVRMLNLAGRPPTLVRLEGEHHGISRMSNAMKAYPAIAAFLKSNLSADGALPAIQPAAGAAAGLEQLQ